MEIEARENNTATMNAAVTAIVMAAGATTVDAAVSITGKDKKLMDKLTTSTMENIIQNEDNSNIKLDENNAGSTTSPKIIEPIATARVSSNLTMEPLGVADDEEDDENYMTDDDDEDDDDSSDGDNSSDDSDFSDLSGLSETSGKEWKPITKPINWVQKQIHSGANPRELLSQMLPTGQIAPGLTDMTLWRILASMLSEPPRRQKLRYINTFDDVIQLVRESKNIIVLTGAGVSVSCGIPDFRSSDGIYSRLAKDFPDLPDPQAMFDINYFSRDPRPFYKFAREIYPGQFTPSPCHRFIKLLEAKQKLLRNYTQNIDTLEQVAGIKNVIECHGSFSTASCTKCKFKTTADAIREDIFAQRIPVCPQCQPNVRQSVDASEPVSEINLKQLVANGIMKPDIVFFGEGLPEEFHTVMANDKDKCDLLIVMGSSLKVRPVALIPSSIPASVPQILINREQLHHLEFDVELLGDSDVIINQLCHNLGAEWTDICFNNTVLTESKHLNPAYMLMEDETIGNLDTDTQSVKSSASTDIALRSTGGYSDSGFESSTSSMIHPICGGVVSTSSSSSSVAATTPVTNFHEVPMFAEDHQNDADEAAAIKKIKVGMLEFNSIANGGDVDDDDDAADQKIDSAALALDEDITRDQHNFSPFVNRLTKKHREDCQTPSSYRHLSIDSSKDSGICDSSNSVSVSIGMGSSSAGGVATYSSLIPIANPIEGDADDCNKTAIIATTSTAAAPTVVRKQRQKKLQSAGERLREGTYYYHESTSSYVFPGAQVSWCSDIDDDDDFDDDEGPVSQLLPSIVQLPPPPPASSLHEPASDSCRLEESECRSVTATYYETEHSLTATPAPARAIKRLSPSDDYITTSAIAISSSTSTCTISSSSSSKSIITARKEVDSYYSVQNAVSCPPMKKRKDLIVDGEDMIVSTTTTSSPLMEVGAALLQQL